MKNYETLKEAGYTYQYYMPDVGVHVLKNDIEELEHWVANKNHASYGLIYKNTHLEYCCTPSTEI